jgi:hypothetical protein
MLDFAKVVLEALNRREHFIAMFAVFGLLSINGLG